MITGKQIRDARKRAGWSQAKLAGKVGVVERTIGGWERGESSPGIKEPNLIDALSPYLSMGSQSESSSRPLNRISDVELLAEIACRFARETESEGTEHVDSSAQKSDDVVEGHPTVPSADEIFMPRRDQHAPESDDT